MLAYIPWGTVIFKMDRFFVSNLSVSASVFTLNDQEERHHLAEVLRLKEGARAEFINGRGILALGQVERITRSAVEVRVLETRIEPPPSAPRLILACAIPKRSKFEDIIDKCTQLGVDEIVPMLTERTEVRINGSGEALKQARFARVAMAAVKQSKRLWAPVIHPVSSFNEVIERFLQPDALALIPWLEGERCPLREALPSGGEKASWVFLIGPEGDFAPQEVALAKGRGASAVTLGANVLRVDTAAEAVVAYARLISDRT